MSSSDAMEADVVCDWCDGVGCDECNALPVQPMKKSNSMSDVSSFQPDTGNYTSVLTAEQVMSYARTYIFRFSANAYIHPSLSETLLRKHKQKWKLHALMDSLMEAGSASALAAQYDAPYCYIAEEDLVYYRDYDTILPLAKANETCSIFMCAYDDEPNIPIYKLWCGHIVCEGCLKSTVQAHLDNGVGNYKEDLSNEVINRPERVTIDSLAISMQQCPCLADGASQRCNALLPLNLIMKLTPPLYKTQVTNYLVRSVAQDQPNIQPCSNHLCNQYVTNQNSTADFASKDVECTNCDVVTCSACGGEGHEPVPCDFIEIYREVSDEDRLTNLFLAASTKPCPHCGVRIEKDRHCNHMQCRKCSKEFCWLCGLSWLPLHSNHFSCPQMAGEKQAGSTQLIYLEQQKATSEQQALASQEEQGKIYIVRRKETAALITNTTKQNIEVPLIHKTAYALLRSYNTIFWSLRCAPFIPTATVKELFVSQLQHLITVTDRTYDALNTKDPNNLFDSDKWNVCFNALQAMEGFRTNFLKGCREQDLSGIISRKIGEQNDTTSWACIRCRQVHSSRDIISLSGEKHNTTHVQPTIRCGKELCSKCKCCREHNEEDCRICFHSQ